MLSKWIQHSKKDWNILQKQFRTTLIIMCGLLGTSLMNLTPVDFPMRVLLADLNPAKNALISIIHSLSFSCQNVSTFLKSPIAYLLQEFIATPAVLWKFLVCATIAAPLTVSQVLGLVVICFTLCDLFSNSGLFTQQITQVLEQFFKSLLC